MRTNWLSTIRISKPLLILVATLAIQAIQACDRGSDPESADGSPKFDRIVLITIDTLRADHLSSYGYPRPTSPFLDSLAADGLLFQKAISQIASTAPSHTSIFTSLYPSEHGVMKNGHVLGSSYLTLAESMQKLGFRTAAIVSIDRFFAKGDIVQGFEHFLEPTREQQTGHSYGKPKYRRADGTVDAAIEWLEESGKGDQFFLWVHLFDPHAAYDPPPGYRDVVSERPELQGTRFANFLIEEQKVDLAFFGGNDRAMLELIDGYDGEIRFADGELQRLFEFMEAKDMGDGTAWIITSDHGEGLGNHRWRVHGKNIYNEQLHVPLIVHAPGLHAPRTIGNLVELIDIAPTVVELGGGDPADFSAPEARGTSLVPLLRGDGVQRDEPAFSQRRVFNQSNPPEVIDPMKTMYEAGEKYSLQTRTHKYIHRTKGADEFYDLGKDPYEIENLAGGGTAEEERMKSLLIEHLGTLSPKFHTPSTTVDAETLEHLEELGYIQ